MADENDNNQNVKTVGAGMNFSIADEDAEKLLADPDDKETPVQEPPEKDDRDWKVEAEKWRSLSRKNERSFKDSAEKLKQYEDANKTELEKLTEDRDRTRAEAVKASAQASAMSTAIERAPEWATPAIIKKVAKRARGDSADELEADVDDLYEMAAPKGAPSPKTPSRPKERLKGGAEPDEEVEETDGRKLAARIPRSAII